MFRELLLYTVGVLYHVELCIRQLWCSSIITFNATIIAHDQYTNINSQTYIFILTLTLLLILILIQTHLGQAKSDNLRGKQELAREQEARVTVDEMLAGYKEEVDTLNEALKIAAMDIAEVAEADEDLLSDEDDELGLGEEEEEDLASVVDDEGFAEAYQGRYDKQKNQADMMAQIGRDRDRDGGGSVRSGASRASSKSQPVTFVIGEDGSFKKK